MGGDPPLVQRLAEANLATAKSMKLLSFGVSRRSETWSRWDGLAARSLAAARLGRRPPERGVPGAGAKVAELRAEEVEELYNLRLAIEPDIAFPIIANARSKEVDELRRLTATMEAAGPNIGPWARANFRFHARLYDVADRPHTKRVLAGLLGLIQPYSLRNVHGLGGRADADREHTAMIAAIDARDPQALRALIHQHLATARDRLLESLSQRPAADPLAALRDMAPAPEAAFRKD
jgi:hypothetical protein